MSYKISDRILERWSSVIGLEIRREVSGDYDSFGNDVEETGLSFYGEEGLYAILTYPSPSKEKDIRLEDFTSKLEAEVSLPEEVIGIIQILFPEFDSDDDYYKA